jgi:hypothetical protein
VIEGSILLDEDDNVPDISQFAAGGRTRGGTRSKSTTTTRQEHRPELRRYRGRAKSQQFAASDIMTSHAEPFLNFPAREYFVNRSDIRMV